MSYNGSYDQLNPDGTTATPGDDGASTVTADDSSVPDGGLPAWVAPLLVVLVFGAGGAVVVVRRRRAG